MRKAFMINYKTNVDSDKNPHLHLQWLRNIVRKKYLLLKNHYITKKKPKLNAEFRLYTVNRNCLRYYFTR